MPFHRLPEEECFPLPKSACMYDCVCTIMQCNTHSVYHAVPYHKCPQVVFSFLANFYISKWVSTTFSFHLASRCWYLMSCFSLRPESAKQDPNWGKVRYFALRSFCFWAEKIRAGLDQTRPNRLFSTSLHFVILKL